MKILNVDTKNRRTGNIGESAAAVFLRKNGYKILKKNYVAYGAEIDIIAQDKEHVAFCEVKTRTLNHENAREPRPACAVDPEKQRKIITASKSYFSNIKHGRKIRYDIIEVYVSEDGKVQNIIHMESAFNYDTAHRR